MRIYKLIDKSILRNKAISTFGCVPLINEGHRIELTLDEFLESIPECDAEPIRHAHWEFVKRDKSSSAYACSLCGRAIKTSNLCDFPYCHCGAKMDEVTDDD